MPPTAFFNHDLAIQALFPFKTFQFKSKTAYLFK